MKNQRLLFLLLISTCAISCSVTSPKHIIGAIEIVQIQGLDYLARIDTGADTTSINAYGIRVENESPDLTANIGKTLRFTTENKKGESRSIATQIVKVNRVSSALGEESRYVVRLAITWQHHVKTVDVNLRDRSKMQFALLLGRNWLKDDFLVDVSDVDEQLQEKSEFIENLLPHILTQ